MVLIPPSDAAGSFTGLPRDLTDSPLAAAPRHFDTVAIVGPRDTWTWRRVHRAAIALARRLNGASVVCNLCSSRANFLVTVLASLRSRRLIVLPPSGGNADLADVLKSFDAP